MRVALIIEWLDAWRGGAETSTQQFMHHLVDLGIDLEVYTRSHLSPRPGMALHTIRAVGTSRAVRTRSFCRKVEEHISRDRPDVVHAVSPLLSADVYQPRGGTVAETIERNLAVRRTRSARAMKRFTSHLNLRQRWLLGVERRMLGSDNGPTVIAISDYVARQLKRHYQLPDRRIVHVFNGVNPDTSDAAARSVQRSEVRQLYEIGDDDLLVIMVAHNFRLKGLRHWLDALTLLKNRPGSNVRSLVLGKDRVLTWQRRAQRMGLDSMVQFPGPTQRIGAFMHAADVLVHPTYYDPCSRVMLESMAAGLPGVTTRFDGASEIIRDGENGFVLDAPDQVDRLADCVSRLGDRSLRQRMGDAARESVVHLDMRRHAEQVCDVYRSIRANMLCK